MPECYIGRQPIFDHDNRVCAYDLLYRSSLENEIGDVNRAVATSRVVVDAFVEIGIEKIVGNHRAVLNVDQAFLIDPDLVSMPSDRVVLQLPSTARPTDETVAAVGRLKAEGYQIALNDYRSDLPIAGLIHLADIVKIDTLSVDDAEIGRHLATLDNKRVVRIAKRVETAERRNGLADFGFDYFQGYFLARPEVITGQRLPSNRMAVMELVTKVCDPNVGGEELANLIATDASLSLRILRFVNSPLSGLSNEVESIHQAAVLLGRETLKSWVILLAMANMDNSVPALITSAFVRAKMCEALAVEAKLGSKESFFTVGLFSLMDAMMAAPMDELLKSLPFSDEMKSALSMQAGARGEAVRCVQQLELGAREWSGFANVPGHRISELYLDSVAWADKTTAGMK